MIPVNCRIGIMALAGEEPACSTVKKDVDFLINKFTVKGISVEFRSNEWIRSRSLKGCKDFDALNADLHGHRRCYICIMNCHGSKIVSGSGDKTFGMK
jgi:hypothetical protein